MKKVYIMDIESSRFEMEDKKPIDFLFAVVMSDEETRIFKSKSDFDTFLLSLCKRNNGKNQTSIIYAHNLQFDFAFCISLFLNHEYIIKPLENGGKLLSVKIGKKKTKKRTLKNGNIVEKEEFDTYLEFRDSFSLFVTSLKKLGSAVGLDKIEHDKRFADELSEDDIEYCKRDCEIVLRALELFKKFLNSQMSVKIEDISKLPPTIASAAFKIFKDRTAELTFDSKKQKEMMKCPWILNNENLNDEFLSEYFFGGRTEVFSMEHAENVCYYDINSLHPYAMISYQYHRPPYMKKLYSKSDETSLKVVGFYCEVDESEEAVPLVPVHHKGGLYFPAMKKKAFLFKEEFDYLKSRNVPITCYETLISFEYPERPFEYLKSYYEEKKKHGPMSYFYKILMNSTYGRFGIDSEKETAEIVRFSKERAFEEGYEIMESDSGMYLKKIEKVNLKFERNVVIAAKIAAMARLELTKKLHKLVENNILFYYTDTDSIVCQKNEVLDLDEDRIGAMKAEHTFAWFQALGNKEYVGNLKDSNEFIVKCKGVHTASIQSVIDYHDRGVAQLNVSKLRTNLNSGWLDGPRNRVLLKMSKTVYHKRIMINNFSQPIKNLDELNAVEEWNKKHVEQALENIKIKFALNSN